MRFLAFSVVASVAALGLVGVSLATPLVEERPGGAARSPTAAFDEVEPPTLALTRVVESFTRQLRTHNAKIRRNTFPKAQDILSYMRDPLVVRDQGRLMTLTAEAGIRKLMAIAGLSAQAKDARKVAIQAFRAIKTMGEGWEATGAVGADLDEQLPDYDADLNGVPIGDDPAEQRKLQKTFRGVIAKIRAGAGQARVKLFLANALLGQAHELSKKPLREKLINQTTNERLPRPGIPLTCDVSRLLEGANNVQSCSTGRSGADAAWSGNWKTSYESGATGAIGFRVIGRAEGLEAIQAFGGSACPAGSEFYRGGYTVGTGAGQHVACTSGGKLVGRWKDSSSHARGGFELKLKGPSKWNGTFTTDGGSDGTWQGTFSKHFSGDGSSPN